MSGVGPIEFVILVTVVVMLFGPTLIAFWLGFTLGRKRSAPPAVEPPAAESPAAGPPASAEPPASEESSDD